MMKSSKLLITIIVLVLLASGLLYLETQCKLENIRFETESEYYSNAELNEMIFNSKFDRYACFAYARYVLMGFDRIPFIQTVDCELEDKNTLIVNVYDKAVTGCAKQMGKYMHFDSEGIIVESADVPLWGKPEITGLIFDKIVLGEKLSVQKSDMFEIILNITMLSGKNHLEASRVDFASDYSVTMYVGNSIFRLGIADSYDYRINNIAGLLEAASGTPYDFDMRNFSPERRKVPAKAIKSE